MKLQCIHADTCLSDYWRGHHLPHISVIAFNGLPLRELKAALCSELNAGAIAGAQSEDERDDAWYAAARAAIDDIELGDPMRDNCFPTLDMGDPHDPDSGWYDDVRAYFVFVAVD